MRARVCVCVCVCGESSRFETVLSLVDVYVGVGTCSLVDAHLGVSLSHLAVIARRNAGTRLRGEREGEEGGEKNVKR